jgi:polar amino acid transport system substrate-binding protein
MPTLKALITAIPLIFYTGMSVADTPDLSLKEPLSIRADVWFPINGLPNSDKPGYMIEMASIIMKKHGREVDYRTMPWERSLDQVRKGNFDCVVGAYKDDAPDFLFPELPWGRIETLFYTKHDSNWTYTGIDSLPSISIGTIGGYAYSEEFDAYVEQNKSTSKVQVINANNALEQNIKKLLAGRIDALVESDLVLEAKLQEMGLEDQLKPAGQLIGTTEMYIACSPDKKGMNDIVQQLNDGLIQLRDRGELKPILTKYGLKDWKK